MIRGSRVPPRLPADPSAAIVYESEPRRYIVRAQDRTLVDALPEHAAMLDDRGQVVFVNRAWRDCISLSCCHHVVDAWSPRADGGSYGSDHVLAGVLGVA